MGNAVGLPPRTRSAPAIVPASARHPGITSAIIGPRTMDHLDSQLSAADAVLSDDILDRIDQIVAPGVTLNPADNGWASPALQPAARRR